jgi:hypothetical protein
VLDVLFLADLLQLEAHLQLHELLLHRGIVGQFFLNYSLHLA